MNLHKFTHHACQFLSQRYSADKTIMLKIGAPRNGEKSVSIFHSKSKLLSQQNHLVRRWPTTLLSVLNLSHWLLVVFGCRFIGFYFISIVHCGQKIHDIKISIDFIFPISSAKNKLESRWGSLNKLMVIVPMIHLSELNVSCLSVFFVFTIYM